MACGWLPALLRLLPLCFLPACDPLPSPTGPDLKAVDAAGQDFINASEPMRALFQRQNAAAPVKFGVEVFVDQTASMHGYVDYAHNWAAGDRAGARRLAPATKTPAAEPAPAASAFVRLLRAFANEEELIGYYGFGSEASGAQTFVAEGKTAPLDPKLYVKLNNDYADLLQQFAARPASADGHPVERVIITDGVQSHRDLGAGSALHQTVTKLQQWVERGGAVEVRLLHAPFAGTYYSEELRARRLPYSFAGRSIQRPFVVISLLSSPDDFPAWERFWQRDALAGLATAEVLRCPAAPAAGTGVTLTPEERLPKEAPVAVIFRNVWDLSPMQTLDGYHDLWRAWVRRIGTREDSNPPTYPASFLLKGIAAGAESDAAAELLAMKPLFEIWHRQPATKPGAAAGQPGWQRVENVDLRDFQNGKVSVARAAGVFRFTADLPVPARNSVDAVVLTVTPPAAAPPPTDWRGASTPDDSTADALNRIYNLQPFVEQLTDHNVRAPTPAGLLVLTYR